MNIKGLLTHPLVNRACFRFTWLGKLICKLTARCVYCGKEEEFEPVNCDKQKEK